MRDLKEMAPSIAEPLQEDALISILGGKTAGNSLQAVSDNSDHCTINYVNGCINYVDFCDKCGKCGYCGVCNG